MAEIQSIFPKDEIDRLKKISELLKEIEETINRLKELGVSFSLD